MYINAFANLSNCDAENFEETFKIIEQFICEMYSSKKNGLKKVKSVDDARTHLFNYNFSMVKDNESFKKKVTTFDPSMIPPCRGEFLLNLI